jgi:hypothetical protein
MPKSKNEWRYTTTQNISQLRHTDNFILLYNIHKDCVFWSPFPRLQMHWSFILFLCVAVYYYLLEVYISRELCPLAFCLHVVSSCINSFLNLPGYISLLDGVEASDRDPADWVHPHNRARIWGWFTWIKLGQDGSGTIKLATNHAAVCKTDSNVI